MNIALQIILMPEETLQIVNKKNVSHLNNHVFADSVSLEQIQQNNQRVKDARAPFATLTATSECSCPSAPSSPCVCRRARTLAHLDGNVWVIHFKAE